MFPQLYQLSNTLPFIPSMNSTSHRSRAPRAVRLLVRRDVLYFSIKVAENDDEYAQTNHPFQWRPSCCYCVCLGVERTMGSFMSVCLSIHSLHKAKPRYKLYHSLLNLQCVNLYLETHRGPVPCCVRWKKMLQIQKKNDPQIQAKSCTEEICGCVCSNSFSLKL